MKRKDVFEEASRLDIQIDTFMRGIRSAKDREAIAIALCQSMASCATYKNSNIFASLSILDEAKKELSAVIAEVIDDGISSELMAYVKERPKEDK
jgi:hypothetical protein